MRIAGSGCLSSYFLPFKQWFGLLISIMSTLGIKAKQTRVKSLEVATFIWGIQPSKNEHLITNCACRMRVPFLWRWLLVI
jgi:hypothetical protein